MPWNVFYIVCTILFIYVKNYCKLQKIKKSINNIYFALFIVQSPNLSHPFHLHGYSFNVIGIGRSPDQNVKKINLKHALDLDRRGLLHRQFNLPPAKDTIAVPNNGYVIFRFRADNPG